MDTATLKGKSTMDKKIVSISSKRQITIPQKFFAALGFTDEAECIVRGNELIIRPASRNTGGEFAEQILADLIKQGLSGDELLLRFKEKQAQVRPAVEAVIAKAEDAANGMGEYYSYDDVFGNEEE
ncbi:MAG: AbrB/MazE/SpoVT family DNA-binding domain-containing protein [Clostridia bacterium]|nr:AbrB/MazE/SpoVT family DNA-binding domain-containing protein [Clostridia bacterium]